MLELGLIITTSLFIVGMGFAIVSDMDHTASRQTEYLARDMQFINGDCID